MYTEEKVYQIWNDSTDEKIEVGSDRDALSLVKIRFIDNTGKILNHIVMTPEEAKLVAKALVKFVFGEDSEQASNL